jgi:peptide/nickel transport system substrate-binding protein
VPAIPTIVQARVRRVDPHDCTDDPDALAVLEAMHDALVRRGPDGRWRPALAESWTVSEDARDWTFRLRAGVRFHDGAAMDAEAAARSVARMARPDRGATLGAPGVWTQYLAGARIAAVDRLTLRVTTERPVADLLDILGSGYVLSPQSDDDAPVGCGAYAVESEAADDHLLVRAVAGHYAGPPANPALRWRRLTSAAERAEALQAGEAAVATGLNVSDLRAASAITRVDHLSPTAIIYLFNAARGPLADRRVRRALHLAIDRRALVADVLAGAGTPLAGFVSPVHFGADPGAGGSDRNPAEARRLLVEAGHGGGLTLDVDCPTRLPDEAQALTAAVAAQLAPLGVTLAMHRHEDRTAYAHGIRLKRIHDLCVFDSSPMSTFRVLYEKIDSRVAGSWWQGYRNAEVEALVDRARATVDEAAREALYRRCYGLLRQDPPWLYLYNHTRTAAIAGSHPGWRMRADGVLDARMLPAL